MEKITEFEFLDFGVIDSVIIKSIQTDSENQQILVCDLFFKGSLVYADKAWIVGEQPFELSESDVEEIQNPVIESEDMNG
jgi:hypothetical protein